MGEPANRQSGWSRTKKLLVRTRIWGQIGYQVAQPMQGAPAPTAPDVSKNNTQSISRNVESAAPRPSIREQLAEIEKNRQHEKKELRDQAMSDGMRRSDARSLQSRSKNRVEQKRNNRNR